MDLELISNSPAETVEAGQKIGEMLRGGEIIAICGQLGAGKTHFIKGLAAGAGANEVGRVVNSPTFVIVNQYSGRLDIYHVDVYRLGSLAEFEMLGFDDYCYPQSVVMIEWADKVEAALAGTEYIKVELSHAGENVRKIRVTNLPEYIKPLLKPQ